MTPAAAFAAAAQSLVGCRFRLHGRDPDTGLDCVGVLAEALRRAGRPGVLPVDYNLRTRDVARAYDIAPQLGFAPTTGPTRLGDVALIQVGPCQHHFAVACDGGTFVHAHAGLRRVVHSPVLPTGTVVGQWRLSV